MCECAGLEVIPDLEVPFQPDDAPVPDVLPSSPQPPGFSGQKSPECEPFSPLKWAFASSTTL